MKGNMKRNKRRRTAVIVLAIIIVVAVALCYVLPLASMGAYATDTPPQSGEVFGTDDPAVLPPAPPEEELPPPTITITHCPATMEVGDSDILVCLLQYAPEDAVAEWSSSDYSVAAVDSTGRIVALAPGDVEVTVMAGELRASALIHVNDYRAESLSILVTNIMPSADDFGREIYNVDVGTVCKLSAVIEPKEAKVESIDWSLSNTEIAEFANGELIVTGSGELSVTATSGALTDTVYFAVAEAGIPIKTLVKYIVLIAVIIVVIVVVIVLLVRAARLRKEEEMRRAAEARRRREEEIARAEAARRRAEEEAELAARIERNRQVLDLNNSIHHPAKVSGATVSATDSSKPHDGEPERPLTLDDIE